MSLKEVRKLFLEIDDNGNGTISERGNYFFKKSRLLLLFLFLLLLLLIKILIYFFIIYKKIEFCEWYVDYVEES